MGNASVAVAGGAYSGDVAHDRLGLPRQGRDCHEPQEGDDRQSGRTPALRFQISIRQAAGLQARSGESGIVLATKFTLYRECMGAQSTA